MSEDYEPLTITVVPDPATLWCANCGAVGTIAIAESEPIMSSGSCDDEGNMTWTVEATVLLICSLCHAVWN